MHSPKKNARFSDRKDLSIRDNSDFVERRRTKTEQIYTMMFMAIIIIVGSSIMVYNEAMLAAEMCIVVGCAMYYVGRKYETLLLQLRAAEIMNAMFSSLLAKGCVFAMVVKPDGKVIYCNGGFRHMFPDFIEQGASSLEALFDLYPLAPEDRQRTLAAVEKSAISKNTSEVLSVSITGGEEKTMQAIQVIIEPVPRPSGYVMLRGKAI